MTRRPSAIDAYDHVLRCVGLLHWRDPTTECREKLVSVINIVIKLEMTFETWLQLSLGAEEKFEADVFRVNLDNLSCDEVRR